MHINIGSNLVCALGPTALVHQVWTANPHIPRPREEDINVFPDTKCLSVGNLTEFLTFESLLSLFGFTASCSHGTRGAPLLFLGGSNQTKVDLHPNFLAEPFSALFAENGGSVFPSCSPAPITSSDQVGPIQSQRDQSADDLSLSPFVASTEKGMCCPFSASCGLVFLLHQCCLNNANGSDISQSWSPLSQRLATARLPN